MIASQWNNYVLVEPNKAVAATALDIRDPDRKIVDRPSRGIVRAVGPECKQAKIGMEVYFDKYCKLAEVELEPQKIWVSLPESEIHGQIPQS